MPKGNVRLFRDDFFNNHPILLEYLVEDTHDASPLSGVGVVAQTRAKFRDTSDDDDDADRSPRSHSSSAGFVDKMRTANPLRGAGGADDAGGDAAPDKNGSETLERPTTAMAAASNAQTSHFSIDPSDPKTTIRKLLKHIEILMVRCGSQ